MGVGIFLRANTNKKGYSSLFVKAINGKNKPVKFGIGIKVKPSDWNKKTFRIKGSVDNAILINRELEKIHNKINNAWLNFEAGSYSWDEFSAAIKGQGGDAKSNTIKTFLETIIKRRYKNKSSFDSYVGVVNAILKEAGVDDLPLKDFTNSYIDELVLGWKQRLSINSIKSYLNHISTIKNLAFEKGIIWEKFERKSGWTKTRGESSIKIIPTLKSEEFEASIKKVEDIYDLQALYFFLMCFCMRGFYQSDLVTMHLYETNVNEPDEPDGTIYLDSKKRRYIKHQRSKSGELMEIRMDIEPIFSLIYTIRDTIRVTHANKINKRTGKPFKKGADVYSSNELEGWFFKYDINNTTVHKNVWDVYQKRIKRLTGRRLKDARKTFESYALKLKISQDIRYKLTGHANQTIKAHYQDWEWDKLKDQVDNAHVKVLKDYRVEKLMKLLEEKAMEL